jgi:hypothetical protein
LCLNINININANATIVDDRVVATPAFMGSELDVLGALEAEQPAGLVGGGDLPAQLGEDSRHLGDLLGVGGRQLSRLMYRLSSRPTRTCPPSRADWVTKGNRCRPAAKADR